MLINGHKWCADNLWFGGISGFRAGVFLNPIGYYFDYSRPARLRLPQTSCPQGGILAHACQAFETRLVTGHGARASTLPTRGKTVHPCWILSRKLVLISGD